MAIDSRIEKLTIHIEGLQATLAKRNIRIEELEKRIEQLKIGEPTQAEIRQSYKRGYKDACNEMMNATRRARNELSLLNDTAFKIGLRTEGNWEEKLGLAASE